MVRYASMTHARRRLASRRPDDLAVLRRLARSTRLPAVLARRARILLLAADGVANTQIAHGVGVSRPTVLACRRRYAPRPGGAG
jgi:DNA-binding CsgD family transcriptional regulator